MTTTETTTKTERPQPTVQDRHGKTWPLTLTVDRLKPLEAMLSHHPRELLTSPERLIQFLADPMKVSQVAYLFAERPKPAAFGGKAVDVAPFASEEEFAEALDSDALDMAAEAVIRLVSGMYAPRGRGEEVAEAIITSLKQAAEKTADRGPEQPAAA